MGGFFIIQFFSNQKYYSFFLHTCSVSKLLTYSWFCSWKGRYIHKTDQELFHPGYALTQRSCKRVFDVFSTLSNYKVTKRTCFEAVIDRIWADQYFYGYICFWYITDLRSGEWRAKLFFLTDFYCFIDKPVDVVRVSHSEFQEMAGSGNRVHVFDRRLCNDAIGYHT